MGLYFTEKTKDSGVHSRKKKGGGGPFALPPWCNSHRNASGTVCPLLNDSHENPSLPPPSVYLRSIVFLSLTHVESSFPFGPPCVQSFTFQHIQTLANRIWKRVITLTVGRGRGPIISFKFSCFFSGSFSSGRGGFSLRGDCFEWSQAQSVNVNHGCLITARTPNETQRNILHSFS